MTAKDLALAMIRPYAERGDDYDSYRASYHGQGGSDGSLSVGGWIGDKHYSNHFVVVTRLKGKEVNVAYSLRELWDEVLHGQTVLL